MRGLDLTQGLSSQTRAFHLTVGGTALGEDTQHSFLRRALAQCLKKTVTLDKLKVDGSGRDSNYSVVVLESKSDAQVWKEYVGVALDNGRLIVKSHVDGTAERP